MSDGCAWLPCSAGICDAELGWSWIGEWIWLMVPVTAELENQGSGP